MNKKVRHVLGISGGKDSAALAIYLHNLYPELDIEYYFCDTGKELAETYTLVDNLENYLGKTINRLKAAAKSSQEPFDHFYNLFGGYLPSSNARWCTKYLKLDPFETFVGDAPVVSYVGIRGDEDREGYISRKPNIQSIFPFRRNIWSEDVISKVIKNDNIATLSEIYSFYFPKDKIRRCLEIINEPLSLKFNQEQKLDLLLGQNITFFNQAVHEFLKTTNYPLANTPHFPLLENEDVLVRDDIFRILRESGVGVPNYYEKIVFKHNGKIGEYARSRSGCYFCFFQQKIEWVWLYEQHPERFKLAMQYENEKEGFTWNQNESLSDLIQPERIDIIKEEYLNKPKTKTKSPYLLDILDDTESEGCAACFI
ncbi:phosphoadenosine phosphosulfate reductase family protein [Pseudoflavitalea sp. X16]|uniref:phosphoadenosine phosphosulfate reductase family protein n=1 Tax=Paraflavitalea devenefica TaxID=2716334 RepID=UPI0014210D5A|nr:phosphoadenosine phosphosulfate reductase family protein [Paraflavitalea devenefica]NII24364.1 phosphoadenosine phosphosulfate reductase family protein [Paraflavitalea devenefica]